MTKSILAVLLVCAGVECVLGALPTMPDSFYLETYGAPPMGMPARTFRRLWYHKSDGVVKYHEYFHAPDSSQVEHKWEHWYDGSKNTTHLWEKVFLPAPSGGTKCNKIAVVAQQTTPPLCVWGDQRYSWSAKSTGTCQRYNQDSTTCDKYTASNSYNGISSNFEVYYLPGTNTPVSMKTTVMVVVSFWMYVVNWDPTVATATQNLTIPTDCLPPPPVVQSSSSPSPSPFSSDTHSDPAVISSSSDEDDDSKSDTTPSDSHGTPSDSHETPSDSHVTPSDSHATPSDSHATPSDSHATPSDSHEAHSSSPTHSSPAQSSHTHSSPAHSDAPSGSDSNVPPSSDTSDEASDSKKSSGAAQESYSIESKASNDSHNDSDSDSDNEIAGATAVSLSALAIAAVTATLFL